MILTVLMVICKSHCMGEVAAKKVGHGGEVVEKYILGQKGYSYEKKKN